jgi:Ca2+-binding RTX toxin-like protein
MTIINGTITQGDDNIIADGANDRFDVLAGNDTVRSGAGDDSILGSFGNDSISGQDGNDTLLGGDQRDTLDGGNGNDTLFGGNDNDTLIGGTGNNLMNGNAGNDTLIAANGLDAAPGDLGDTLFGGAGIDELRVDGASSYVLTNTTLNVGNVLVHQLPVATTIAEGKVQGVIERISLTGNSFGNTIDASAALLADRTFLNGREGSDNIIGSQGLDQITGGDGADSIVGGAGFNFIDGNDDNDTLIGGNDGNNLEGNAGNDVVQGGAGDDSFRDGVFDGAGDDRYIGGEGDDELFVNGGEQFRSEDIRFQLGTIGISDVVQLKGGKVIPGGNIDDSATGTDTLEGIETVQINGTEGSNVIDAAGFDGDVIFRGLGGSDRLIGGNGNDSLQGTGVTGNAVFDPPLIISNDTLSGGLGNDTLDGGGFGGDTDILTGGNAFNGVGSADTFQILDGYRGTGHAVITDFSVQDGDELRLRFPFQGSPSDFTFVQQNFNPNNPTTGTNSSSILDTVVFFGAPSAGDVITVLEDVNVNASTPGVEIFG